MIELGQLERRHEDFARRNTRVIAISVEGTDDATKTQASFPHLVVIADQGRGLSEAVDLVHGRAGPGGEDIATPTTIVVDKKGTVRWMYRTREVFARLSPDDVLQAVDSHVR
jgi:alkyl hydroperoxide reductase subunit AhpC